MAVEAKVSGGGADELLVEDLAGEHVGEGVVGVGEGLLGEEFEHAGELGGGTVVVLALGVEVVGAQLLGADLGEGLDGGGEIGAAGADGFGDEETDIEGNVMAYDGVGQIDEGSEGVEGGGEGDAEVSGAVGRDAVDLAGGFGDLEVSGLDVGVEVSDLVREAEAGGELDDVIGGGVEAGGFYVDEEEVHGGVV